MIILNLIILTLCIGLSLGFITPSPSLLPILSSLSISKEIAEMIDARAAANPPTATAVMLTEELSNAHAYELIDDDFESSRAISTRDRKMAAEDPMRYCADRCLSTGYCDVFEEFYDLSPREVVKFCQNCIQVR